MATLCLQDYFRRYFDVIVRVFDVNIMVIVNNTGLIALDLIADDNFPMVKCVFIWNGLFTLILVQTVLVKA